jgi:tripartite-type tricarboxylate transporter receptor subunit TctC
MEKNGIRTITAHNRVEALLTDAAGTDLSATLSLSDQHRAGRSGQEEGKHLAGRWTVVRNQVLALAVGAIALACLVAEPASAQEYPDKAVKLVVPFAAGGPTDVVARLVAEGLSDELKQAFVVENRPGAGGAIGTDVVAKAKPDGYILGVTGTGSIAIIPFLDSKLSYNPSRDLTAVAMLSTADLLIVARPDLKQNSVKELIDFARAKPGELTYSTAGVGTPAHLDMENLWSLSNVKAVHVAFPGDVPAIGSILSGDVNIGLVGAASSNELVKAGKLKAIAFGGPGRSPAWPALASVEEQTGLKGYVANSWNALMAPAGTPQPIIDRLNTAVNKTLAKPGFKQKLEALGLTAFSGDAKTAVEYVARDTQTRKRVIEQTGLKRE